MDLAGESSDRFTHLLRTDQNFILESFPFTDELDAAGLLGEGEFLHHLARLYHPYNFLPGTLPLVRQAIEMMRERPDLLSKYLMFFSRP